MKIYIKELNLYIQNADFNGERFVSGDVINGEWFIYVWEKNFYCLPRLYYDDEFHDVFDIVNVVEKPQNFTIVLVPFGFGMDYNAAIEWAEKQPAYTGSWQDALDQYEIERVNYIRDNYPDLDDDIPF